MNSTGNKKKVKYLLIRYPAPTFSIPADAEVDSCCWAAYRRFTNIHINTHWENERKEESNYKAVYLLIELVFRIENLFSVALCKC